MNTAVWVELIARAAASLPALITVIAKARTAEKGADSLRSKIEAVLEGIENGVKELGELIDSAEKELG